MCVCLRNSGVVGLTPPLTALITPEPVRHSRIPDLPLDSNLLFEALLFLYLLVALFVQYINIYRTVWWSSYSHPSASTSLVQSNHTRNITVNISLLMYLLQWNTKGDVVRMFTLLFTVKQSDQCQRSTMKAWKHS